MRQIKVQIRKDVHGYVGRECPSTDCLGYFKITPGTGLTEPSPCHCPYCGHVGEHSTFFTKEQIQYARSMAMRQIRQTIHGTLKSREFVRRAQFGFGFDVSLKVRSGPLPPIRSYREKELETEIVCSHCTLRYAIYGNFAWCPDCGSHNSLQILERNLELARKEVALAAKVEPDLADHLIGDALENAVSALDGFGRELSRACGGTEFSFQNIESARRKVRDRTGSDIALLVGSENWITIVRAFQKRHLLAHRLGVIDKSYIDNALDPSAVVGRKVTITMDEVACAIEQTHKLGRKLYEAMQPTP